MGCSVAGSALGLFIGALAGLVMTRERRGFGIVRNLGLGLAGAIVGGVLFQSLQLLPGLDKIAISLRDIVAELSKPGRDARDAAPIRGIAQGPGRETLDVTVAVLQGQQ